MKGLTPEERWALERLLLPMGTARGYFSDGSSLDELYLQLLEQGRAVYTRLPEGHEHAGFYSLTPAGREALKLWPAVQEALGAR